MRKTGGGRGEEEEEEEEDGEEEEEDDEEEESAEHEGDEGADVPWVPGEWHEFNRVNLAEVQVKGTPGDIVTVVGGTW